jgi:2-hydroxychromene-2-carboxylate isomerase
MGCGTLTAMQSHEAVKLYFDYKSPFAYLAKDPAFDLPQRYQITLRWIPFVLRIKGKGERSLYSEYKARYSYIDARRWANRRGGFKIMGPLKVYNSEPALIGGLYAQQAGFFRPYTDAVFARFFQRALEIDVPEEIARLIDELHGSGRHYLEYLRGAGAAAFHACQDEASSDHVFGVPLFLFRGEQFWGYDRMGLLEERLAETGLCREP